MMSESPEKSVPAMILRRQIDTISLPDRLKHAAVRTQTKSENPYLPSINASLLVILFFGAHTGVSLDFLPHDFLSFIGAAGILIANNHTINRQMRFWALISMSLLMILATATSMVEGIDYGTTLRATLNFSYDITIGVAAYIGLMRLGAKSVSKLFFVLLIIFVAGAMLEVFGPIKGISDWFRHATHTTSVYEMDARDQVNYGALRPKFFATEPAALGLSISSFFLLWLASIKAPTTRQYGIAALLLVAALYFVRSPVIIFGAVAYLMIRCMTYTGKSQAMTAASRIFPMLYVVLMIAAPIIFYTVLTNSAEVPLYITTTSFYSRVIAPYTMALQTMKVHPVFGIGLLNEDGLTGIALGAYAAAGRLSTISPDMWSTLGPNSCNAFWFMFISLGVAGIVVLAYIIKSSLKVLKARATLLQLFQITAFTFWYVIGRVNEPWAWIVVFSAAALLTFRGSSERPAR